MTTETPAPAVATWRALARMERQVEARLARALAPFGLSYPDFVVLSALGECADGRRRVVELAGELGWEKSRVSHQVARMTGRGLVEKQRCPTDQRGAYVALTGEGATALEAAAPVHGDQLHSLFTEVARPAELSAVAALAERVLKELA